MNTMERFDLTGQTALVTGAASGLGLAYTEVLAEAGAKVMLTDANGQTLREQVMRLRDLGRTVEGLPADVTHYDELKAAFDDAVARWGQLDICFANAGISGGMGIMSGEGAIENLALDRYLAVIEVNQHGVVHTLQLAAQKMIPARYGRIVITSSIAGLAAEQTSYAYSMSKAAVAHLAKMAARQLAPHNIMVNAIAPGPFYTHIGGGQLAHRPDIVKRFEDMVPQHRLAQPDEIKGLALLLASPAASYLSGAVIPIDGGALTNRVARRPQ